MNKWFLAAYIAAQAFDVTTTVVKLNQGCVERVWHTQNPWVIGGIKGGAVVFTISIRKRKPKVTAVIAGIGIGSGFIGGIHNLGVRCGE